MIVSTTFGVRPRWNAALDRKCLEKSPRYRAVERQVTRKRVKSRELIERRRFYRLVKVLKTAFLLPECMTEPQRARLIVHEVAIRHSLTSENLFNQDRRVRTSMARHEAIYRIACETDLSLPRIGAIMKRDHTTMINSIRKHAAAHNLPIPRQKVVEEAA